MSSSPTETKLDAKAPEFHPSTPTEGVSKRKRSNRARPRGSRGGRNRGSPQSNAENVNHGNDGRQISCSRQNSKPSASPVNHGATTEQGENKKRDNKKKKEQVHSKTKKKKQSEPPASKDDGADKNVHGHDTKSSANNSSSRKKKLVESPVAKDNGAQATKNEKAKSAANNYSAQKHQGENKDGSGNKKQGNQKKALQKGSSKNGQQAQQHKKKKEQLPYPPFKNYQDCLARYAAKDPTLVRGRVRALPKKDGMAFITCDRGTFNRDVLLETRLSRNRALDGDTVFVELLPPEEKKKKTSVQSVSSSMEKMSLKDGQTKKETWQDDKVQMRLWNPLVRVRKAQTPTDCPEEEEEEQRKGQVVFVVPPRVTGGKQPSELNPADEIYLSKAARRAIVGTLKKRGGYFLLVPNSKALPEFFCKGHVQHGDDGYDDKALYKAEYVYGSWRETDNWPPCENVQRMGTSCNVQDETMALLTEFGVDHGDFPSDVFKDVDMAVESGTILPSQTNAQQEENLGWKPTQDMIEGRRDYRKQRIFTIDPTTAKDLDDALHITQLPDGRVEIGVHIADVSHFIQPDSAVDQEAKRRATTVYLVNRTVPMLPRPLCEVACSLNEDVERLAFSCVWRMNMDGTLDNQDKDKQSEVWYGRTVIKSCARLDYATAQNIIENKVATGESPKDLDETLWPKSRRPTGGHTIDQVAQDVRLMNRVAQARRKLRFQNGALALNGIKLAFQLEEDGETPKLCAPYPIRDSNRLVEEYMLLANFLVAQRLITHSGGLALLRRHPPPLPNGLDSVVNVAKEGMGFDIDASSSQELQTSLSRLGRECRDELVLQCVTEMLMTPMQPAEYIAAGCVEEEYWRHFALNIPYYTHFTSPIRRYPDILVHRLLQATIDGEEAVESFPMEQKEIHAAASHCNDKRMASKKAQERSDRVFLALYLRKNPLKSQLGVVLSVGEKTFTVYVPSLGLSTLVFLDEHKEWLAFEPYTVKEERRVRVMKKNGRRSGTTNDEQWTKLDIKVFTKICVTCICNDKPPIDVRAVIEGPWTGE